VAALASRPYFLLLCRWSGRAAPQYLGRLRGIGGQPPTRCDLSIQAYYTWRMAALLASCRSASPGRADIA
jgi:hypothetical protein